MLSCGVAFDVVACTIEGRGDGGRQVDVTVLIPNPAIFWLSRSAPGGRSADPARDGILGVGLPCAAPLGVRRAGASPAAPRQPWRIS